MKPPRSKNPQNMLTLVNKSAVLRRKSLRSCQKTEDGNDRQGNEDFFAPEKWCLKFKGRKKVHFSEML